MPLSGTATTMSAAAGASRARQAPAWMRLLETDSPKATESGREK